METVDKKAHYTRLSENITAVIQEGCDFKGTLSFEGLARIGGSFEGEIFTNDILIIEETAKIKANINADVVIISGQVLGDVFAKKRIETFKPAIIKGNLVAPSISMEEGVVFEGSTKMA
jgi:cytoskeletal protein CcmA (bactofilin family)